MVCLRDSQKILMRDLYVDCELSHQWNDQIVYIIKLSLSDDEEKKRYLGRKEVFILGRGHKQCHPFQSQDDGFFF